MYLSKQKSLLGLLALPVITALTYISNVGETQLLYYNDLQNNGTSTSALLIYKPQAHSEAASSCAALSESLLPEVTQDLRESITFFVYSGQIKPDAQLRLAGTQGENCVAYSIANSSNVQVSCNSTLPALCTQSAPPYSISQIGTSVPATRQLALSVNDYTITGYRDARSFRFLGIPFAQPPLGALRFAAPLPYNGSTNISALQFSKACVQYPSPYGVSFFNQTSEDCLSLNVFTPYLPAADEARPCANASSFNAQRLKPVMVYFYGGSFIEGWSAIPDYDGGNLASRGDVILVTLNYRVAALGFLTSQTEVNGNMGLQDQILALEWIQQNIQAFGGDPSQVTIFGQSAGAQSVVYHLASSASKGLFSAAISQSSLQGVIPVSRNLNVQYITPALANATNCTRSSEAATIQCLRNVSAVDFFSDSVMNAMNNAAAMAYAQFDGEIAGLAVAEPYVPITAASGGPSGIMNNQILYLIRNGTLPNQVPFMAGTNRNEAGLFIQYSPGFENPLPLTQDAYAEALYQVVPNNTRTAILQSGLFPLNTSDTDGVRDGIIQLLTESAWTCPWQQIWAEAGQQNTFPALYTYRLDKGTPQADSAPARCFPEDNPLGQLICHTEEIPEVFGRNDIYGYPYNNTVPLRYTQYIMDTWISFVRTHNPTPSPAYLQARGSAYQSTLYLSTLAPFVAYNSTPNGTIHHFDYPPYNAGISYPEQCALLTDTNAYPIQMINNAL